MSREPVDLPILDPAFKTHSPSRCRDLAGEGSLVRVRLPSGAIGWMAVSHGLARALLRDARLVKQPVRTDSAVPPDIDFHPLFRHLLTLDPPEHTRLRAVLTAIMPAERLRKLRPQVEAATEALVTELAALGETPFDLLAELALPLPIRVIAQLLGIPVEDEALIQSWSVALLRADLDDPGRTNAIAEEIDCYLRALAAEKRRAPDSSVMSAFVDAEKRGLLTGAEVSAMSFLLLAAGHETSVNLIANGVLSLLQAPEAWRSLCADPSLARAAVEEVLRYESPLEFATPRYVAADITVAGHAFRRGDLVFVGLGAANRDPLVFEDAGTFKMGREGSTHHMAFGQGVHTCPGAHLARLESEVALAALAHRLPSLTLAVAPETLQWVPGLVMRGLVALPVRIGSMPGRLPRRLRPPPI